MRALTFSLLALTLLVSPSTSRADPALDAARERAEGRRTRALSHMTFGAASLGLGLTLSQSETLSVQRYGPVLAIYGALMLPTGAWQFFTANDEVETFEAALSRDRDAAIKAEMLRMEHDADLARVNVFFQSFVLLSGASMFYLSLRERNRTLRGLSVTAMIQSSYALTMSAFADRESRGVLERLRVAADSESVALGIHWTF